MRSKILSSLLALSPLMIFFILFIGTGVYFSLQAQVNAFYQVSASVIILPSIIIAMLLTRKPFQKKLNIFLEGARDNNIIIMCLIYLLAGAFSTVLQGIGGVSSVVNFALNLVPQQIILPTLFLMSAAISTAMGTSMGTIAAIGPIAVGIATSMGLPLPLTMGTIIGGAMFGDNLSMISDTSIAATQIHGCSVYEKFKNNLIIALPAMGVTLIVLTLLGFGLGSEFGLGLELGLSSPETPTSTALCPVAECKIMQCLPYLAVLCLALTGCNVFLVLIFGILLAAGIGLWTLPSYSLISLAKNIFDGYNSMSEILILSILMGGLGELMKTNGGFEIFNILLNALSRSKEKMSRRTAESAIASITSFSDICTANNTVAIILSGKATHSIAQQYKVPAARAATLVDIFSCTFQGILPYSAQVLMAGSLAGISPLAIVPNVYYCFLLGVAGIAAIVVQLPKVSFKTANAEIDNGYETNNYESTQ